jgi:hypothetical protein
VAHILVGLLICLLQYNVVKIIKAKEQYIDEELVLESGESLHHGSERRAMYVVTDAVFGLAIGLAAFSLTEYQITVMEDVYFAIGFFFLTFFFISLFWMWVRRFFDDFQVRGEGVVGILYILCFLVAILPFIMRLFFSSMFGGGEEVALMAQTWLYPLDMGFISMLVCILHLLFLKQGRNTVPWPEYKHIAKDGFAAVVIGGGFLLTAIVSVDLTLGDLLPFLAPYAFAGIPAKIGVWFILIIVAIPVYIVIALGLRRMERSYEYHG